MEEDICKPAGAVWLLRYLKGMVGDDIDAHLPPVSPAVTVESK